VPTVKSYKKEGLMVAKKIRREKLMKVMKMEQRRADRTHEDERGFDGSPDEIRYQEKKAAKARKRLKI
jgi:hypothetical protein